MCMFYDNIPGPNACYFPMTLGVNAALLLWLLLEEFVDLLLKLRAAVSVHLHMKIDKMVMWCVL